MKLISLMLEWPKSTAAIGLTLFYTLLLFLARKRDPIDSEAGVKLDGQE